MSNNTQLTTNSAVAGFGTAEGFALIQRVAKVFSSSNMVPAAYQGDKNLGNCIIAINMAQRLRVDPLTVMQNLNVIQGKPSWSTQFLISMFNGCGRFAPIRYQATDEKGTDSQGIIAYTYEKATGDRIDGEEVTIGIAKAEGWYGRNASKWKTMPGQMLRYRAAAWLIRSTAPELSLGLGTQEEAYDIANADQQNTWKRNIDQNTGEVIEADADANVDTGNATVDDSIAPPPPPLDFQG